MLPHLTSALLSLATATLVYLLLRRSLAAPLAWLGVALFMGNRLFVRFGAQVMTDLPVTGMVTLSFVLFLEARQRASARHYALLGCAVAATTLMKYTLGLTAPALLLAEALLAHHARRLDRRRALLLLGALALAGLVVVGVHAGLFATLFPASPLASFRSAFAGEVEVNVLYKGDPWALQLWFAVVMQAPALIFFTVAGVALRLRHMTILDRVMLAWLLVVGGGVLLVPAQITARYVLPALPAVIYFALTSLVDLQARFVRGQAGSRQARLLRLLPVLLLLSTGLTAAHQMWLDMDPVLRGGRPATCRSRCPRGAAGRKPALAGRGPQPVSDSPASRRDALVLVHVPLRVLRCLLPRRRTGPAPHADGGAPGPPSPA